MLQANGRLGDWGLEYTQKQSSLRLWVESTQLDSRTWSKGRQGGVKRTCFLPGTVYNQSSRKRYAVPSFEIEVILPPSRFLCLPMPKIVARSPSSHVFPTKVSELISTTFPPPVRFILPLVQDKFININTYVHTYIHTSICAVHVGIRISHVVRYFTLILKWLSSYDAKYVWDVHWLASENLSLKGYSLQSSVFAGDYVHLYTGVTLF